MYRSERCVCNHHAPPSSLPAHRHSTTTPASAICSIIDKIPHTIVLYSTLLYSLLTIACCSTVLRLPSASTLHSPYISTTVPTLGLRHTHICTTHTSTLHILHTPWHSQICFFEFWVSCCLFTYGPRIMSSSTTATLAVMLRNANASKHVVLTLQTTCLCCYFSTFICTGQQRQDERWHGTVILQEASAEFANRFQVAAGNRAVWQCIGRRNDALFLRSCRTALDTE